MPDPEYSEEARETKLQGTCVLSLVVDTDGRPRNITVIRKLGKGLDEKAVETARTWRFEPARKDGVPVADQIQIKVSFSLGGKLPREQLKQMAKLEAETQARMKALVYRISDDVAPKTCRTSTADDKLRDGSTITIAELSFEGDLKMPATEQARVISRLISRRRYSGSREETVSQVLESIRSTWEDHGYVKVKVYGEAKTLSADSAEERLAITARVDEGPQYRLRSIGFKNNTVFNDTDGLRGLFSIKDGEPYSGRLIAEGLGEIRSAYARQGFINFTASPEININDASHTVSVDVAFQEGKQFFVRRIDIMGLDEPKFRKVRKELLVMPGDVYNARLVGLFFRNHEKILDNDSSTEPSFSLQRNEENSTVAITYDFRHCKAK
jgi:TonB family protein